MRSLPASYKVVRIGAAFLPLALGLAGLAAGATFYVNAGQPQASDSNSGASPEAAWATLQHAADTVSPGDTVIVYPGDYARTVIRRSGDAQNRIVFTGRQAPDRSLMNPQAVLDPLSPVPVAANTTSNAVVHGITLQAGYVDIRHFEITAITGRGGIQIQSGSEIEIAENFIHDLNPGLYDHGGIRPESHAIQAVRVLRNVLYHVQGTGISLMGQGWLVEGNDVSHGTDIRTDTGEDTGGDVDAIRFFGSNHVIRNNYLHHYLNSECAGSPHMDAFQTFSVYPDSQFASNILVENNRCEHFGQMFMCEDQSEQSGGINAVHHITFRNNTFHRARAVSIIISDYTDYFTFVNNVVSESYYSPLSVSDHSHHITVLNNIFYRNGQADWATAQGRNGGAQLTDDTCREGSVWDYNLYHPDFTWPYKISGDDSHSLFGPDPAFVDPGNNDFHLMPHSPARDIGLPSVDFNYDLENHFRPHGLGWDLGAYEYGSVWRPPSGNEPTIPVTVFPNPAGPQLFFRFSPTEPAVILIDVYNAAGEKVCRLAGGVDPGWRDVAADTRGWAPGVYFYRVTQNQQPGNRGKFAVKP